MILTFDVNGLSPEALSKSPFALTTHGLQELVGDLLPICLTNKIRWLMLLLVAALVPGSSSLPTHQPQAQKGPESRFPVALRGFFLFIPGKA